MKPRFVHDCVNPGCCTFVGSTLVCDVYVYRSMLDEQGMIMRHSDEGADYHSFPTMAMAERGAAQNADMRAAYELVKLHGLKIA